MHVDSENALHTPIAVYYPEFSQMDFIQDSLENQSLEPHLEELVRGGLPWDDATNRKYLINNLEVYVEIRNYKKSDAYFDIKDKQKTSSSYFKEGFLKVKKD